MRRKLLTTLLGFVLILTVSVSYGFETGNDLVQGWREHQRIMQNQNGEIDYQLATRFSGYVIGVFDATEHLYGLPYRVTKDQVTAIVGKYLDAHPEKWSEKDSDLVIEALIQAFPHKKK